MQPDYDAIIRSIQDGEMSPEAKALAITDVESYRIPTADAGTDRWTLMLGDSCERLGELDDNSIDLSIFSPPFGPLLYTYSPTSRDVGNCRNLGEFVEHYGFIIDHMLRLTKPGRLSAVHVAQTVTQKGRDGYVGLTDLRGAVIAAHIEAGWIYHGEITVQKNPQAQAVRTKSVSLLFATLERDSAMNRPALADYVLLFRKPGDNAVPVRPTNAGVTRDDWITWAHPIWPMTSGWEDGDVIELGPLTSTWDGIRESATLNAAAGRDQADERHICPLQLPLIDRAVRLWSNPDELVCSPFAGIGSEGYQSILRGRRFVGCELKASYFATACENLRRAEYEAELPSLFDEVTA